MEGELQKIGDGILALMDKKLVPSASTGETKVSYCKMRGDYYRFFAEFATGETKSNTEIAEEDLVVTHPVRLAMAQRQSPMVQSTRALKCVDKVVVNQVMQVPQVAEQDTEVPKTSSRNRTSQRSVEQIIETPSISLAGKMVEMPVQKQQKTRQVMNTHVHHVDEVENHRGDSTENEAYHPGEDQPGDQTH